jgi:Protein of unknown function (DUF3181)
MLYTSSKLPITPQILMASTQQIEELAAEIGDKVYMDVAKWHLYLKDAKLHTTLAEQVFPLLISGLNGERLTEILTNISIDLGGGRQKTSLLNLIPVTAQARLMDILQDYARTL